YQRERCARMSRSQRTTTTGRRAMHRLIAVAALMALTQWLAPREAPGHETDQFTLPPGREFADLKDYITRWAFDIMERGVEKTNERIRQCLSSRGSRQRLAELQSADEIVRAINTEFPNAYDVIEGFERDLRVSRMQNRYPGMLICYKE